VEAVAYVLPFGEIALYLTAEGGAGQSRVAPTMKAGGIH
jgi:hypothetical protein